MKSWMERMAPEKKALIEDMMTNEDGLTLSRRHGLSPARVSQIRKEAKKDWEEYVGDKSGCAVRS